MLTDDLIAHLASEADDTERQRLRVVARRLHEAQLAMFELDYDDVDGYSCGSARAGFPARLWEDVKVSERYL